MMRTRLAFPMLCAAMVFACAGPVRAQTRTADRSADAAAIRAHIESIFAAFIDKDRKKLEATHGADWRGFTTGSRRVIRGLDDYMKSATYSAGLPKGQGMVGYRISDFDVVFYGDTAVVSFIADVDLVDGAETTVEKLTLVDVYHKEPKGWIQVASNTSYHPDSTERQMSRVRHLSDEDRAAVLKAREAVWRAWFAGDTGALGKLVPAELITIEPDAFTFGTHESNMTGSRGFAASGGKLLRLAFPRTEFQAYGNTVILYTTYEMEIQSGGQTRSEHGAATEVFVQQNDRWINTGWQLAPVGK
jgi:uncharacterized protein DUF4440